MFGIRSKKVFHLLLVAGVICTLFSVRCGNSNNNKSKSKEYFKEFVKKLPPEEKREFLMRMRMGGRLFPAKSVGCSSRSSSSRRYGGAGTGAGGSGTGTGVEEQSTPVSEIFKEIWRLYTPSPVGFVYLSPDGRYLYAVENKITKVSYNMPFYASTKFYAIELAPDNSTGTIRWVWEAPELKEAPEESDVIISLISIGPDGTIYLSVIFWTKNYKETLYAIDPSSGAIKWSKLLLQRPSTASPLFRAISEEGVIYTGGGEAWYCSGSDCPSTCFETGWVGCQAPYIYAINPDGTEKWRILAEPPYPEAAFITFFNRGAIGSDGTLYTSVVFQDPYTATIGYVYAISPDGSVKWRKLVDVNVEGSGDMNGVAGLGPDGTIYIAAYSRCAGHCPDQDDPYLGGCNPPPKIWALDPKNGDIKWEYPFHKDAYTLNEVVIGYDGTIYATGLTEGDIVVVALNPDGSVRWKKLYASGCLQPSVFAITRYGIDEVLYLGNPSGLYLIDAETGQLLSNVETVYPREEFVNTDIVVLDGLIYMPSGDCDYWPGSFVLYCGYNPRILSLIGTGPLTNSTWPKRYADNQATSKINTNR